MDAGSRGIPLLSAALFGLAAAGCTGSVPAPQPLYAKLPKADAANADGVLQYALEALTSGATASWSDPEHNASGAVTPLRTFRTKGGLYCREVEELISLEGAADSYRLVGCRYPDGVWRPAVTQESRTATLATGS